MPVSFCLAPNPNGCCDNHCDNSEIHPLVEVITIALWPSVGRGWHGKSTRADIFAPARAK
jgi:hypothetical protein